MPKDRPPSLKPESLWIFVLVEGQIERVLTVPYGETRSLPVVYIGEDAAAAHAMGQNLADNWRLTLKPVRFGRTKQEYAVLTPALPTEPEVVQ